jgi:hypothetical protein
VNTKPVYMGIPEGNKQTEVGVIPSNYVEIMEIKMETL